MGTCFHSLVMFCIWFQLKSQFRSGKFIMSILTSLKFEEYIKKARDEKRLDQFAIEAQMAPFGYCHGKRN